MSDRHCDHCGKDVDEADIFAVVTDREAFCDTDCEAERRMQEHIEAGVDGGL